MEAKKSFMPSSSSSSSQTLDPDYEMDFFWDFENLPFDRSISMSDLVGNIKSSLHTLDPRYHISRKYAVGNLKISFIKRKMGDLKRQNVKLVDSHKRIVAEHQRKKEVADRKIVQCMLESVLTSKVKNILLISTDTDFELIVDILKMHGCKVFLAVNVEYALKHPQTRDYMTKGDYVWHWSDMQKGNASVKSFENVPPNTVVPVQVKVEQGIPFFWDFNTCPLIGPAQNLVDNIQRVIHRYTQDNLSETTKILCGDLEKLTYEDRQDLERQGLELINCKEREGKKKHTRVPPDFQLEASFLKYVLSNGRKAPKNILIVTGDYDFNPSLKTLQKNGSRIFLAKSPISHEHLKFNANYTWDWKDMQYGADDLIFRVKEGNANYEFDLFVIGAGSGGVRAARFSANNGAKVGICELPFDPISSEESGGFGGTCVIRGCVPKKILVYGSTYGGELEDAKNYGWEINENVDFSWKKLLQKKIDETLRLNNIHKQLLEDGAVKLHEGEGRIVGPNKVEVRQIDGTKITYTAEHILIATGSRAKEPNIPGHELAITSDEALSLEEFPKSAVVVGGGYIAVEFASIWRGMGATINLCFREELPLRGFDDEMRALVARNLKGRGINLHPHTILNQLIKTDQGIKVASSNGEEFVADVVLFATGRIPNTKILNLEAVGVQLDGAGAVKVDEYSRTNIPNIWAVGDATNRINLTPVALMEATCFANTVFGGRPTKPDYSNVACAVFCIPPLAVVGLSEEKAVEQATGDLLVFTSSFNHMKNTMSGRQEKSLMKLIVDEQTDKVIGASMCGPDAAEIMQGIAIALKCGATKAQFDSTAGIHPSFSAEESVTMTRRIAYKAKH